MGKKKGPAWNFFKEKNKGVECKYCCKEYKHSNVNKMTNHIKKCFKCPADMKKILDYSNIVKPLQTVVYTSKKNSEKIFQSHDHDVSLAESVPGSSSNIRNSTFSSSDANPNNTRCFAQTSKFTSSQEGLGLLSFVDHMDAEANVSNCNHYNLVFLLLSVS